MRDLVDDVELLQPQTLHYKNIVCKTFDFVLNVIETDFDWDLIDLVKYVDAGDVDAVAFDDVD